MKAISRNGIRLRTKRGYGRFSLVPSVPDDTGFIQMHVHRCIRKNTRLLDNHDNVFLGFELETNQEKKVGKDC